MEKRTAIEPGKKERHTRSPAWRANKTFSVHKLNALSWLASISFRSFSKADSSSSVLLLLYPFFELCVDNPKQYFVCCLVWSIIAITKGKFQTNESEQTISKQWENQKTRVLHWERSSSSLIVLSSLWSSAGNVLASVKIETKTKWEWN